MTHTKYEGKYFKIEYYSIGCGSCMFNSGPKCQMPGDFPLDCSLFDIIVETSEDEYLLAKLKGKA